MLTIRTRIFIMISIFVLFVLGVSVLLIVLSKRKAAEPVPAATDNSANAITQQNYATQAGNLSGTAAVQPVPTGVQVLPQSPEDAIKNGVRQLAKTFLERYGSYSTDSNYQNIRDVQNLVTPEFWKVLEAKIGTVGKSNSFVGVTSVVPATDLTAFSDSAATVRLSVIQTTDNNGKVSTVQKQAVVSLTKFGNNWLVSKLDWK
ncbi:MAG: hypothetical protein Q7S66_01160 [bacterium]|nr:hypothetical protein [bacterium]